MRIYILTFLMSIPWIGLNAQHACIIDDQTPLASIESNGCNKTLLTLDEILALPNANFKLAFHFKANVNGENFTCDPNDPIVASNSLLLAQNFVYYVMNEMNTRMSSALLLNGQNSDAKIRFSLANGGNCNSIYFYESNESFINLSDAINIRFVNDPNDPGIRGWTGYGSNNIYVENALSYFLNGSNNTWDIGRLINHEFGHTRHLKHAFNCSNPCDGIDIIVEDECCGQCWSTDSNSSGCFGCSSQQLMMAYGIQLHMTECEMSEIWNYIVNNPRPYQEFDICEETNGVNEIVYDLNAYEIWDDNKTFNKDVRIKSGTTIEVKCEVLMGNNKRIIVEQGGKLIVNDGLISNLCSDLWKGIQVYGGSSDYAVEVINNSIIENVSVSAISMFHHSGWLLGGGNAHIYIDNSTFNNCNRVLAMGAIQPSYNTTIVNNSVHNGGKMSITNWNCYNVEITNNEFNDISNECIVTEVGQFRIEGNTFNSGRTDILFANVNPGYGTFIEDNQFNGSNTGVRALGTAFGQHEIRRNQFRTGEFDLFMDGDNNYLIDHNDITADFGGVFADNGNHSNNVFYNQIEGNFVGLMPLGSNGNYLFYNNCFNTSYADNFIEGQVSFVQASNEFDAANNCFTHQGNANHPTYDMTGNPDPFIYVEPNINPRNCLNAEKAHPNIIREFGASVQSNPCVEAGSGNVIPPQYNPCNPKKSIEDTQIAIAWLQNKILEIQNNPNLTDKQKQWYIAFYRRCLKRVQWSWFQLMFEAEKFDEVRKYLKNDRSNDAILVIFTSYIFENDLDAAHLYLASLSERDEQLSDFITIQVINLKRLRNGNVYEAKGSELATVETIARKRHPYAGYAKALYYWLTGEIISTELPDIFKDHQVTPRSMQSKSTKDEISIYPNPFSNLLTIKYSGEESANVTIVDLFGRSMYNNTIDRSIEINTSLWNTGMYIVSIRSNDEIIHQEKLMLIH